MAPSRDVLISPVRALCGQCVCVRAFACCAGRVRRLGVVAAMRADTGNTRHSFPRKTASRWSPHALGTPLVRNLGGTARTHLEEEHPAATCLVHNPSRKIQYSNLPAHTWHTAAAHFTTKK